MKTRLIIFIAILAAGLDFSATAQRPTRFHNEAADTTRLTRMLINLSDNSRTLSPQQLVAQAGRMMIDTPYGAGTLEGEPEMVTVNLDSLDCTTFVENAIAMAMTIENHRNSWQDFIYNLETLRYKDGKVDGYPSRLHYISDWIVDNSHRGNLQEVTDRIGKADYIVKTLDFMSSNRNLYPALANDETFSKIKDREIGYRSHRYPAIKPQNVKSADIREGDIIAITTTKKGLDVTHLGIAVEVDGEIHLMHASSKAKRVIIDPLTLSEYLRRNRTTAGIRVIRLK